MKKRLSTLMNKILNKVSSEKKFEIVDVSGSGHLNEIQYRARINLISSNNEKFCILFLEGDLDELTDEEITGSLVHELAHFFSPKSTIEQRKFMLLVEISRQIEIHKKIIGSRFLPKLIEKKDALHMEIGGGERVKKILEWYDVEENATDSRASKWGFEKQIKSMREKQKTYNFGFRFAISN
ncbi:MAG: hypothetical protein ABFQ65_01525 [Nanoarchaeota archaeon]